MPVLYTLMYVYVHAVYIDDLYMYMYILCAYICVHCTYLYMYMLLISVIFFAQMDSGAAQEGYCYASRPCVRF